jgi:hypothetical protein
MNDVALAREQDRHLHAKASVRAARAISWLGHPLVFVTFSVCIVVALRLPNRIGLAVLLTLFVAVILPMALLLFGGVRSGRWSDADVSVRTERTRFYPRAIPISAIGVIGMWFLRAPSFVLRGALVTFILLLAAAVVNLRIKLSLHALFACYCSMILLRVNVVAGVLAFALTALVFWSRLCLGRHDLVEMLTGTALGICGGITAAWWP